MSRSTSSPNNDSLDHKFWEMKSLEQMTGPEWEALCDGCGLCCLHKVEDEDTLEVFTTAVHCQLFDPKTCSCKNYKSRKKFVKDCLVLTPKLVRKLSWLPKTCAYRLIAAGEPLPSWHHLVSGHKQTVHSAGKSAKAYPLVPERDSRDIRDHIIDC